LQHSKEWLDRLAILKLTQRQRRRVLDARIRIVERGDQRFRGPSVSQLAEKLGRMNPLGKLTGLGQFFDDLV
jgi:hypothetical protein